MGPFWAIAVTSVNLADKPATYLKCNLYSFHNPKEYLNGSDAVVFEQGPYNLRKYTVAYDVSQTTSSLTAASQLDPKGALECIVPPTHTSFSTRMRRPQ